MTTALLDWGPTNPRTLARTVDFLGKFCPKLDSILSHTIWKGTQRPHIYSTGPWRSLARRTSFGQGQRPAEVDHFLQTLEDGPPHNDVNVGL